MFFVCPQCFWPTAIYFHVGLYIHSNVQINVMMLLYQLVLNQV